MIPTVGSTLMQIRTALYNHDSQRNFRELHQTQPTFNRPVYPDSYPWNGCRKFDAFSESRLKISTIILWLRDGYK